MDEVEVVVAHSERATLRVGDVFLKVDADQTRLDNEVAARDLVGEEQEQRGRAAHDPDAV